MKNYQISKLLLASVAMWCVVFAGLVVTTGCPQKDAVRQAVEASYRLPKDTTRLEARVKIARDTNIITPEQAQKMGEILYRISQGEVVYVKAVKSLVAAMHGGAVDKQKFIELRTLFDESVVKPFLEILQYVGVLTGDKVQYILVAVAAVRMLLVTIGGGIGSTLLSHLIAENRPSFKAANWRLNYA